LAIEVEARSFISHEQYENLINFMKDNAEFLGEENQVTYYFSGNSDLRIQKNDKFSKVWLKKGSLHDDHREEIEVRFDIKDFEKLEKIFKELGYVVEIKWFRLRNKFSWEGIKVTVDHTRGYGYIIELEKIVENDEENVYRQLEEKIKSLGIEMTPKEVFNEKFKDYKNNWKRLVGEE